MGEVKGEIIIFEHANFRGAHRHIINEEPNLNHKDDNNLNDKVSSFVVIKGIWRFYQHADYHGEYRSIYSLGLGDYPLMKNVQIENDQISSLSCMRAGLQK